jgi:hypothetical protein
MFLEQTGDITDGLQVEKDVHYDVDQGDNQVMPKIIDDGLPLNPRPQCTRRAPHWLSFDIHQPNREWNELNHAYQDLELIQACASDTTLSIDTPGSDASIFEPVPSNIRAVLDPGFRDSGRVVKSF